METNRTSELLSYFKNFVNDDKSNSIGAERLKKIVQERGEIPRSAGDYDTRKRLTQKPLTTSDLHSICILHSYLNVLKWF